MGIDSLIDGMVSTIQGNPITSTAGALGAGVALGVGGSAIVGAIKSRTNKRSKSRSSRKRGSRITHTRRGLKQDRRRRSKQKWEVAYRKRKRGVRYTKNGQPYIILASGKARFIKGKRRKR